jgi:hypothetical protein
MSLIDVIASEAWQSRKKEMNFSQWDCHASLPMTRTNPSASIIERPCVSTFSVSFCLFGPG